MAVGVDEAGQRPAGADETSELGVQRFIKISSRQKYLYKSFFS